MSIKFLKTRLLYKRSLVSFTMHEGISFCVTSQLKSRDNLSDCAFQRFNEWLKMNLTNYVNRLSFNSFIIFENYWRSQKINGNYYASFKAQHTNSIHLHFNIKRRNAFSIVEKKIFHKNNKIRTNDLNARSLNELESVSRKLNNFNRPFI